MDPNRRAELDRAFRATTYAAAVPLRLRLGEANPLLDALLAQFGLVDFVYISAWNPGSRPRPEAENRAAHQRLLEALVAHPTFVGAGEADDGSWPPEPSVLALGVPRGRAIELGRAFGQAAIVAGQRGRAPELVWIE